MPDWSLHLPADWFGFTTRNVDGVPLPRPRVTSQHQPVSLLGTSTAFPPATSSRVTASPGLSACPHMRSPSLCEQLVRDPSCKRESLSEKDFHPEFPESGDARDLGRSPFPSIAPTCGDGILLTAQTLLYHTSTITNFEIEGRWSAHGNEESSEEACQKGSQEEVVVSSGGGVGNVASSLSRILDLPQPHTTSHKSLSE
jgi:hypothetical protein